MGGNTFLRFLSIRALGVALIGAVLLVGFACGDGDDSTPSPTPTPTVTPTPTPTATPDPVAEGQQLFIATGCAACHGQNAEGTDIAPSLAGHGEGEVKRQVRNPVGSMPSFDPEKISDDALELIAHFIESLEPADDHREPVAMADALVVHHWMALHALEAGNADEAEHHVQHIIESITEDMEHKAQMEEVLGHIQDGDFHDASHAVEEMLVGKAQDGLSMQTMHLELALSALGAGDPENAEHHLQHFIDAATGDEKAQAQEALDMLRQGNTQDAEHEVEELLQ